MSLPTSQSIPEDNEAISPSRRRRDRRLPVPAAGASRDERLAYLDELAERAIPSVDYYLFAILTGLAMGAGILFDSTPLLVLGAVLVPLTGPFLGLGLATIAGSGRFFLQSLASMLIAGLLVFVGAMASGYAGHFIPSLPLKFNLADTSVELAIPALSALTLGVIGTAAAFVRSSGRSIVAGAVLTYLLFVPISTIGVGLAAGNSGYLVPAAVIFAVYLAWAVLLGALTLGVLGLRPVNAMGYVMGALVVVVSLSILATFSVVNFNGLRAESPVPPVLPVTSPAGVSLNSPAPSSTRTVGPSATPSPVPSTTNTLIPTLTPSQTITPAPTPVWAIVDAASFNGAYIRSEPKFGSKILTSLLNGSLVQVLPGTAQDGGTIWVKVRTTDGREGWIVQGLLVTATPVPGW